MQQIKLFYDGSCRFCRQEMQWLAPKLEGKLQLVDISQSDFSQFAGVSKADMMAVLHLWNGRQFVTGLDASLYYWQLAGFGFLVRCLRIPPVYWLANRAYGYWAKKRPTCAEGVCDERG